MKQIVRSTLSVATSIFMRTNPKFYFWRLELECGHKVERRARRKPIANASRGYAAIHHPRGISEILPAPKRVRCEECARGA